MKTKITGILLLVFLMGAASLQAAPERLPIKDSNQRTKERTAKAQLRNFNLQNIEDPEARKAIQEILNYLNLQTRR